MFVQILYIYQSFTEANESLCQVESQTFFGFESSAKNIEFEEPFILGDTRIPVAWKAFSQGSSDCLET